MPKKPTSLMRYHGAKWRMAEWIVDQMPNHYCYAEPFGGSAAVLLNKPPASREVYNDLNEDMVDLFRVIRCDDMRHQLLRKLAMTPYSRIEFLEAKEIGNEVSKVDKAHALLVRAQMGFASAGATRACTGFRLDTKRGGTSLQKLWSELPDVILYFTERLKNVIIEHTEAFNIIEKHDSENTLFYIDPPYVHETRTNTNSYASFELSLDQHEELLSQIVGGQGKFMISGYDHELYNDMLKGFKRMIRSNTISSQYGGRISEEILWLSPNCEVEQIALFD